MNALFPRWYVKWKIWIVLTKKNQFSKDDFLITPSFPACSSSILTYSFHVPLLLLLCLLFVSHSFLLCSSFIRGLFPACLSFVPYLFFLYSWLLPHFSFSPIPTSFLAHSSFVHCLFFSSLLVPLYFTCTSLARFSSVPFLFFLCALLIPPQI